MKDFESARTLTESLRHIAKDPGIELLVNSRLPDDGADFLEMSQTGLSGLRRDMRIVAAAENRAWAVRLPKEP